MLHFGDQNWKLSPMFSQLESKVLCFGVPKQAAGGVLGTPKMRPHAMFLKPGQRPSAEFSVTENGGSVPCWWGSESGSTPHFGDWAMVTGSAAVGLSPAPVSRPVLGPLFVVCYKPTL